MKESEKALLAESQAREETRRTNARQRLLRIVEKLSPEGVDELLHYLED